MGNKAKPLRLSSLPALDDHPPTHHSEGEIEREISAVFFVSECAIELGDMARIYIYFLNVDVFYFQKTHIYMTRLCSSVGWLP